MKKGIAALLVLVMAACIFVGCAEERGFFPEYDIEGCVSRMGEGSLQDVGGVDFEPMLWIDGEYTLPYRLYIPASYDETREYPLLLFLHGAGERGDDNLQPVITYAGLDSFFDEEDDPAREAIVLIPQCPVGDMWVDVDASEKGMYSIESVPESAAMSAVLKLIKFTVSDLSVDTARIYAMGMSMGGYGTWDILARHTDLLAAAVPICGGCDVSCAEAIKEIPIRTFHGALDPIVPPDGTRAMAAALEGAGAADFSYTEYADGMHDIWNRAMQTEGLDDWLFAQKKE